MEVEIVKHIGKAGKKEINIVSWNGRPAKLDIREWYDDHNKCKHGLTFTDNEARELLAVLKGRYE